MKPITEINGRTVMYENERARQVGMLATCNCCDRIIYEDEKWLKKYKKNGGYCRECAEEVEIY